MAFDIDGLGSWKDESGALVTKAIFEGVTASKAQAVPGISGKTKTINIMDASVSPADRVCGWSASGDVTYTQVDLVCDHKQVKESMCISDLEDKYLAMYLSDSANGEDFPFLQLTAEAKAARIKEYVDAQLWSATTAGGSAFNGLSHLTESENTPTINVAAGAAAPTLANIVDEVNKVVAALPADSLMKESVTVFMSPANFNLYRQALVADNLFMLTGADFASPYEIVVPGTPYKVTFSKGITGDRIVALDMEYVYFGTGLAEDMDAVSIFYSADNDEYRLKAGFKYSIALAFPELHATNDLA